MEPKSLQVLMQAETERRATMNQFIKSNLTEDTDYGTIKIGGRESKACLFKPGAEKFCSLLQLRAEFQKDEETLSMLSDAKDQIAYICRLIHIGSGQAVAEGRGACSLKEKQGIVNTTIKIAEKRAQIDAVLRLGFSDSFTQDLEDTPSAETQPKQADIRYQIMGLLDALGHNTQAHTPDAKGNGEIARLKDPKTKTLVTVNANYAIETILPGDTIKILNVPSGSSSLLSGQVLRIQRVEYDGSLAVLHLADITDVFGSEI